MKKKFLCYYQLHVEDRTFTIHRVIEAKNASKAIDGLTTQYGESYSLKAKGCLGELTLKLAEQYLTRRVLDKY